MVKFSPYELRVSVIKANLLGTTTETVLSALAGFVSLSVCLWTDFDTVMFSQEADLSYLKHIVMFMSP